MKKVPVYEYQCPRCSRTVEEIRCIVGRDEEKPVCEHNGMGVYMQRVISPTPGSVKDPAVPRSKK